MAKSITLESSCKVPVSDKQVWDLITDDSAFHGLGLPGTYSDLNLDSAGIGTIFYSQSLFGGDLLKREIKEWKPFHLFSFGSPDDEWTFKWQINKLNDKESEVIFLRRFRAKSGFFSAFKTPKYIEEQSFTNKTITNLSNACKLISENKDDGIDRVN